MFSALSSEDASSVPEANVVLEEDGNRFFFNVKEDIIEHYGTINKNGTVVNYDQPGIKLRFPLSYGESYSETFSGEAIATGGEKYTFTGNVSLKVDGFGKLILPGNIEINDVVRLKTTKVRRYEDASYSSVTISYKWYCQEVNYSLLTIIRSGTSNKTRPVKTAYYGKAGSISQIEEKTSQPLSSLKANVYPNPFNRYIKLDYELTEKTDVQIEVFDNAGKKIKEVLFKNQPPDQYSRTVKTEEESFSNGMYYITIKAGNQSVKKSLLRVE